jgi:glutaredoxin-related protein
MESDERRLLHLLTAKKVAFKVTYLDIYPEKKEGMVAVSNTTILPQLHVHGRYYGDFEELQDLEDRGDLDFIFQNAAALGGR